MKTLIFNGSPRPHGDTMSLIQSLCDQLSGECRIINTYRDNISACIDCRWCWEHSGCAIKDDMQDIYLYIQECDNIVIASPIYFSELTGKLLDTASRLQSYFSAKYIRKEQPVHKSKKGAIILTGGGKGSPDKADGTARMLLSLMNCTEIKDAVSSLDTDHVPASKDLTALDGVRDIARFFSNNTF